MLLNQLKVYVSYFFSTVAKGNKILPSPKQNHKDNMTFNKAHFKFNISQKVSCLQYLF